MAKPRRGRRGGHLLLGLVGVLGAMRPMAERMEVGFAGWKMDRMGPHPPQRVRRTEASETGHFKIRGVGRKKLELVSYHNVIGNSVNSVSTVGSISSYKLSRQRTGSWRVPHALAAKIVEVRASQALGEVGLQVGG